MTASASSSGPGAAPGLPALSPEALLAESRWVRRLAGRLLRDPALADDLTQETWLRALERAPRADGPPRSWLAGVARNLARQGRRERARRDERERRAARPEQLPSALDALERIQRQRSVVDAVLALDEPYRSTIVLRFYEGLPPRRIAAKDGVPVATVKTRLARGLALLRAKLDGEHGGDGRSWVLFLLPLARGRGLVPLAAGVIAVGTLVKIAAVAAVLAGALLWMRGRNSEPARPALAAALEEPRAPEELLPAEPGTDRSEPAAVREALATTPAAEPEPPAPSAPELIAGRVIDVAGNAVAGVELGLRESSGSSFDEDGFGASIWREELRTDLEPVAVSGPDGRFAFPRQQGRFGSLVSQDVRWESVLAPFAIRPEDERIVVVAPRFRLEGRVVDQAGAPLAGVDLRFGIPPERYHGCGVDLTHADIGDWHATSDALGRFAFDRLPSVAGAILRARLEPFEAARIARESWSDDALEIVLERPAGAWLTGIVVARGEPVAGASVVLGLEMTGTDERGAFELHLDGELAGVSVLRAAAAGFLPASFVADLDAAGRPSWPPFVRLELAGEPLALAGTVVDAEGRPRSGQEVWLTTGRTVLWDEFPVLLESILSGERGHRLGAVSDGDGRFRIGGLEARDYGLRVVDPKTALVVDSGPFAAGSTDLRLRQPTDALWPEVRGVVVTRAGTPLANCRVNVVREVDDVGLPERSYFMTEVQGSTTMADEDGAFVLRDVPKEGVRLSVAGEADIFHPVFALGPDLDPLDLRITVGLWVALEVRVSHEPRATAIGVLDDRGEHVTLRIPRGSFIALDGTAALVEGRSPVVSVGDHATTLVLYGGDEELARVPLVLLSDRVNIVDL